VFIDRSGDRKELAYLDDALSTSLDQLISAASADARRLLWIVAVANDPVVLGLLRSVWSGDSLQQQQLRQLKRMMDRLPPDELQAKLRSLPEEVRALLDNLPPDQPARPPIEPLLRELVSVGLATEERTGPEGANPSVTCAQVPDIAKSVCPVAGDRGQVRPRLPRSVAADLRSGAGLGGSLFVEREAGVRAAAVP